jgi:glycosyltransferase involved in cell wall biosynthesis
MGYPKVLIIGETFRLNGGGGITLFNLFKEWPVEMIAIITDQITETYPHTNYNYYQLGSEEIMMPFPFNLFQTHFQSGPYNFNSDIPIPLNIDKHSLKYFLKQKLRCAFDYFLNVLGLTTDFYSISLSPMLSKWILTFNPDIIYIQPFLHKTIKFGNRLFEELKIPYAVHIMDDSVSYINKSLFFRHYRQEKIENDFKVLINNAKVLLSISEAMSGEYSKRYGRHFEPFRNPIEIDKWIPFQKQINVDKPEYLKIIYTGRLFSPTFRSLIDFCQIINDLNKHGEKVEFHIYTHDKNDKIINLVKRMEGVKLFEPVNVNEMPRLISKYDVFFLCLDFTVKAFKYSRFSISTRTSEGMISGVPILVYAPKISALSNYFLTYNVGAVVGVRDKKILKEAILKLWNDVEYRKCLSRNAIKIASSDSNAFEVRKKFREILNL